MKRTIECLEIKGYKYNPMVESQTCSAFYDKEDNEDISIGITPDWSYPDRLIISYKFNCQIIRVVSFLADGDSSIWGDALETFIMDCMPAEMKD